MDYKSILKKVYTENKMDLLRAIYNVSILTAGSTLRLGRYLSKVKDISLKSKLPATSESLREKYRSHVKRSADIYNSDVHTIYGSLNELHNPYVMDVEGVLIVIGRIEDECHVVIRGSKTVENWTDSLNAGMQWSMRMKSMVHDGYLEIARAIVEAVENYIRVVASDVEKVRLYGHSMGGGLSVMTGYIIHNESLIDVEEVVSIGGPKVIQADYSELPVTHIFHVQDPIPYVPVWSFLTPYRHQGERILITPNGTMSLYSDSLRTDLYSSIWVLNHKLDVDAHSRYDRYF